MVATQRSARFHAARHRIFRVHPRRRDPARIIVDDPDAPDPAAPKRVFVHWVLVDIPPDVHALAAGASDRSLPAGAREGKNDMHRTRYGGPCPPIGRHRYYHKLYALDTTFPNLTSPTKAELLATIEGHILAQAELMGTYQRQSPDPR
jgi:Raf kinase inhibitor-like YbhB/YbcL family protein